MSSRAGSFVAAVVAMLLLASPTAATTITDFSDGPGGRHGGPPVTLVDPHGHDDMGKLSSDLHGLSGRSGWRWGHSPNSTESDPPTVQSGRHRRGDRAGFNKAGGPSRSRGDRHEKHVAGKRPRHSRDGGPGGPQGGEPDHPAGGGPVNNSGGSGNPAGGGPDRRLAGGPGTPGGGSAGQSPGGSGGSPGGNPWGPPEGGVGDPPGDGPGHPWDDDPDYPHGGGPGGGGLPDPPGGGPGDAPIWVLEDPPFWITLDGPTDGPGIAGGPLGPTTAQAPLPSSLLLLGAGAVGASVVAMRRRRKQ